MKNLIGFSLTSQWAALTTAFLGFNNSEIGLNTINSSIF